MDRERLTFNDLVFETPDRLFLTKVRPAKVTGRNERSEFTFISYGSIWNILDLEETRQNEVQYRLFTRGGCRAYWETVHPLLGPNVPKIGSR